MAAQSLLTSENLVQVPVIIVTFGEGAEAVTFGLYDKKDANVIINSRVYKTTRITYPNYVKSLKIKKVNGQVNTYTLSIVYPVTPGDDPNLIDKVLSKVSNSRKITFTYGDANEPAFMYREEEALITDVTYNIDIQTSTLSYTITAVSSAILTAAGSYNFPGYNNKKPSDLIKEVLYNNQYKLTDIFYGMRDKDLVERLGLIPGDDRSCKIERQTNMTPLNYISYLVSCMAGTDDKDNSLDKSAVYVMTINDDTSGVLKGPYFKIYKVATYTSSNSAIEYYSIDIGYQTKDYVLSYTISDNQAYAILFDYSQDILRNDYSYRISDVDGSYTEIYSPPLTNNYQNMLTTNAEKSWWASMTSYPITATLKLKGLLRAVTLMSYITVRLIFHGRMHNSSGTFIITGEEDSIDTNGYQTILSLTRIEGLESEEL